MLNVKKEKIVLKITYELTADRICDMFVGAFEGGSNYWINTAQKEAGAEPKDKGLVWWGNPNIYQEGLEFRVLDIDAVNHHITWADIIKGIEVFAVKSPSQFSNMVNESGDGFTADCFLQYIVFGELVYG